MVETGIRKHIGILADTPPILTIASQEKAAHLADASAPVQTGHGLLLTMWDVEVILR